jgi:hypothetical protein
MNRKPVHDRRRASARAIGDAEVAEEDCRRVREARRVRVVATARRDADAVDLHGRLRRFDRVVALGEELEERRRGSVRAVVVELWQPEPVQVRLVADDQAGQPRELRRHSRGVLRELRPRLVGQRRRPAAELRDADVRLDPGERGRVEDVRDRLLVVRGRSGLSRRPDQRDADGVEPGEPQHVELGLRLDERELLDLVLRRADAHRRAARVGGGGEHECPDEPGQEPHRRQGSLVL